MIHLLTIQTGKYKISFGIPTEIEEYRQMMELRYQVYYEELGYSSKDIQTDRDYFDKKGVAHYVIAKVGDTIVGTVRVIIDEVPPMAKFYTISDQKISKKLHAEPIADVGRLISRAYQKGFANIPRGIVSFGLLLALTEVIEQKGVKLGCGSIKPYVLRKLKKMGLPIMRIRKEKYKLNPNHGIPEENMGNFFQDEAHPPYPVLLHLTYIKEYMVFLKETQLDPIDGELQSYKAQKHRLPHLKKTKIAWKSLILQARLRYWWSS
jgi:N-acyl-L-homoserine lactone synthetase